MVTMKRMTTTSRNTTNTNTAPVATYSTTTTPVSLTLCSYFDVPILALFIFSGSMVHASLFRMFAGVCIYVLGSCCLCSSIALFFTSYLRFFCLLSLLSVFPLDFSSFNFLSSFPSTIPGTSPMFPRPFRFLFSSFVLCPFRRFVPLL